MADIGDGVVVIVVVVVIIVVVVAAAAAVAVVVGVVGAQSSWMEKKKMHRPGIEPGPPAVCYPLEWQASILPLNHRCDV